MRTGTMSGWDVRKSFIENNWPLFSEKDLQTLQKHPENIVIKLQRIYHYSKYEAYQAYFALMKTNVTDRSSRSGSKLELEK